MEIVDSGFGLYCIMLGLTSTTFQGHTYYLMNGGFVVQSKQMPSYGCAHHASDHWLHHLLTLKDIYSLTVCSGSHYKQHLSMLTISVNMSWFLLKAVLTYETEQTTNRISSISGLRSPEVFTSNTFACLHLASHKTKH